MRYIFKYSVSYIDTVIEMPVGAIIRHAGSQRTGHHLWAEVRNPSSAAREDRIFRVFATGEEIPDGWDWRYTWQDGPYVWHVFEKVGGV
jgi:hypothetical protein